MLVSTRDLRPHTLEIALMVFETAEGAEEGVEALLDDELWEDFEEDEEEETELWEGFEFVVEEEPCASA